MKHVHVPGRQRGFTLVEIAIVLVIIGLLLGAILKGQELIENSRVKNASNEISSIRAGAFGYLDRYKALPGDDGGLARLQARGSSWVPVTGFGNTDGTLGAAANPFANPNAEHLGFWQHLRAAGFITGDPALAGVQALPKNAFGGLTGVAVLVAQMGNFNQRVVCMSQVPGKAGTALDNQLDDGRPDAGSLRATLQVGAGNAAPAGLAAAYSEDQKYTICTAL
jgi:prepilin-type N-terminal cleavage/methylation domain-containing protein